MHSLILLFGLLLCSVGSVHGATSLPAGISYKNYQLTNSISVHVLTLDPRKVKIILARAQDVGPDSYTVDEIAKHFSALAAINGGFFRVVDFISQTVVPVGILKANNQWHGIAYKPRGAIGWDPVSNKVLIDILQTETKLTINQQTMPIQAMNKILTGNRASFFSDSYSDGINVDRHVGIIFAHNKIQQIHTAGEMFIPAKSYAYYAQQSLFKNMPALKIGDPAVLQIRAIPQLNTATTNLWNKLPYIVGGGPLLIYKGRMLSDFSRERMQAEFINQPHARTAVGILANNNWVFVVSVGNMLQETTGLTIPELSKFMLSLGCVAALNLDGGGSSTMYLQNNELDDDLLIGRPVADALLVLPRN